MTTLTSSLDHMVTLSNNAPHSGHSNRIFGLRFGVVGTRLV